MRKILRAAALTLTLCAPAFAGDIPNPPAPPPNPTSIVVEEPVEEPASDRGESEVTDIFMEAALNLLDSVLALF